MLQRTLFPFGWSRPTKLALVLFLSALYVYLPVFTLYLQSNGLSLLQVNSLWGILVAALFLAEVPTGMLADRIGRARSCFFNCSANCSFSSVMAIRPMCWLRWLVELALPFRRARRRHWLTTGCWREDGKGR